MRWTNDERELYHIRGRVVLASNAARLDPPIDTVHLQLNDLDSFHQSATRSRDLGFFGKLCIHPKQVKYANEAFTPSSDEIERAKLIISAFNEAENSGSASIQVDGQFVDYPVFEAAQRTLRLVDSILDSDIEKKK